MEKEMRGKEVPLGVPEICTHKIRKKITHMVTKYCNKLSIYIDLYICEYNLLYDSL